MSKMRVGCVVGIIVAGALAFACSTSAPTKGMVVQKDGTDYDGTKHREGEDPTELGSVTEDNGGETVAIDGDGGTAPPPDAATPSDACKGWWCPSPTKSKLCTSDAEGNTSQSSVTYSDENGTIKILSIATLITNKNHRDLNDAKVYAKANANDHTFVLKIDTGDTLPDGKTVQLQIPSDFSFPTGGQLRIDTNFDDSFGDPMGRCELQF